MGQRRDYVKDRRKALIARSIITPRSKVARPPTAAETMCERSSDKPVTLPHVKWLERPEP